MILVTIIAFIVIFSLLVLVHEFGHFIAARKFGVKVEEFGLGLPPLAKKIFKDKKGTWFTLNWIPFGGFVRLFGEDTFDPKVLKDKQSFASKTILQRTIIILGGVFMNFVLAWVLITFGFLVGMKPFLVTAEDVQMAQEQGIVDTRQVLYIHEVMPESVFEDGSIVAGDYVIKINNELVPEAGALSTILKPNTPADLTVMHGEEESVVNVVPNDDGKLGVMISTELKVEKVYPVKYPIHQAPVKALYEVGRLSVLTVEMLGQVIVSIVAKFTVPAGVAGPVGIAKMTHTFVQQGFMAVIQFMALISISLGVINVMPFPALDGGRFLFIIFELVSRRKPNAKMESIIHTAGFGLLMLLILFITWNDIVNLFV